MIKYLMGIAINTFIVGILYLSHSFVELKWQVWDGLIIRAFVIAILLSAVYTRKVLMENYE